MASTQKSSKVTIANLISIIGLVLLLVFSFMGYSYKSGGELGWDILISVAITAITAFLLWFLIKAKGAENNVKKWRILEVVLLVIYIVFAIATSMFGGIMHFFVVNEQKEEIKELAGKDVEKIYHLFSEYQEFESTAISITGTGLKNATGPSQLSDTNLKEFMKSNHIAHNRESARNFETIQKNNLIGVSFENFFNEYKEKLEKFQNVVNSWSIVRIPQQANAIEELAENAEKKLTELSHTAKLPTISYDSEIKRYTLGENQCQDFEIEGGVESFEFKNKLKEANGFSWTAFFVVLVIHLLIIFNYVFAWRTNKIGVGKNIEEDGGIIL